MKFEKMKQSMLPAGFALGLFASPQPFVLTAPDNSMVGRGTIEEISDSIVQAKITIQGQEFSGSGTIGIVPAKRKMGVRSDRALLGSFGKKRAKHANTFMVSKAGTKLACEFNILDDEIEGQCINPDNQQRLAVETPPEGKP